MIYKSDSEIDSVRKGSLAITGRYDKDAFSNLYCSDTYSVRTKFSFEKMSKEELCYLLNICNETFSYDDALEVLEHLVVKYGNYTIEDKKLIEIPIINVISVKEKHLKKVLKLEAELKKVKKIDTCIISMVEEEKVKFEAELAEICSKFIDIIDVYLLKNIICKEFESFLFRLKADLYKCFSFIEEDPKKKGNFMQQAEYYYTEAMTITEKMNLLNVCRLEIILSFAEFYVYVKLDYGKAMFMTEEIVKNFELQDFYEGKKKESKDKEILSILLRIKEVYDNLQLKS